MAASITAARAEVVAALTSASVTTQADLRYIKPPCVVVMANGSPDLTGFGKGLTRYSFRVICIVAVAGTGAQITPTVTTALETLTGTVLTALRDLAGWQLDSLGPESRGDYASGSYLAADVIASTYIAI